MLTTLDNPYNPYDNYDQWSIWDQTFGYNTAGKVAREVGYYNPDLTPSEKEVMFEEAYQRILDKDKIGIYGIIKEQDSAPLSTDAYKNSVILLQNSNKDDLNPGEGS